MIEYIDHTADVQFVCKDESLEGLFLECALGMRKAICDSEIRGTQDKGISVKGKDLENLLYNFLEEILFVSETENLIYDKGIGIKITKKDGSYFLNSKISFGNSESYEIHLEIKSITYNEMYVKENERTWEAKVTLDV